MVLVQSKVVQGTQNGDVVDVAFTSSNTAGNIIVVFCANETDGSQSTLSPSISDGNTNSYNQESQAYAYSAGVSPFGYDSCLTVWFAPAIASGANTVSFDFSVTTTTPNNFNDRGYSIVIAEFSPASTSEGSNHGAGTSTTADPGSVTSSTANSLFLAGASVRNSTACALTTPTSYTSLGSDTNAGASSTVLAFNFAYYVNSGSHDGSFGLNVSTDWGAVAAVVVTPITGPSAAVKSSMLLTE